MRQRVGSVFVYAPLPFYVDTHTHTQTHTHTRTRTHVAVFEVKRLLGLEDHSDITLDRILTLCETLPQV